MKVSKTITVDLEMAEFIRHIAQKEHRSINSQISFLLEKSLLDLGYHASESEEEEGS